MFGYRNGTKRSKHNSDEASNGETGHDDQKNGMARRTRDRVNEQEKQQRQQQQGGEETDDGSGVIHSNGRINSGAINLANIRRIVCSVMGRCMKNCWKRRPKQLKMRHAAVFVFMTSMLLSLTKLLHSSLFWFRTWYVQCV